MEEDRSNRSDSDYIGVLIAGFILAVAGWAGLAYLILNTQPTALPRWLFFACLFIASTGTVMPFVRFLNARFWRSVPPSGTVILRQSMWVAMFITGCAWLRIPRMLNWITAFFLALSLIVIEIFLRLRERAQSDD
jgi:hypothetical protein